MAINPQNLQAAGYSVALANDVKFIRCQAEKVKVVDAQGHQNPALGFGVGFGWAPDPRPEFLAPATNVLYLNCIAAFCQVGFDTWDHIDSVWAYIVSKCNDIPILVQENGQRTISCNACSQCGCLVRASQRLMSSPLITKLKIMYSSTSRKLNIAVISNTRAFKDLFGD